MKTSKIQAIDTFSHGRLNMRTGETETIEAGEAKELKKAGLVEIVSEHDGDADDLLGETKMETPVENKMEKTVSNKSVKK